MIEHIEEARANLAAYLSGVARDYNLSVIDVEYILLSQLADVRNDKILALMGERTNSSKEKEN